MDLARWYVKKVEAKRKPDSCNEVKSRAFII